MSHGEETQPGATSGKRLIARTLETWQPRTDRRLSPDDAVEIQTNMVGFVRLLLAWIAAEGRNVTTDHPTKRAA